MQIKKICPHEIIKISPERYNKLYTKFRSLNELLAWTHARAIENLLEKYHADVVIVDKFAEKQVLEHALLKYGKEIGITQAVHAERYRAVAAASVLARATYLYTLKKLSREVGYPLPKGAYQVVDAAKQMVQKHGNEILPKIAKMHFKTTKKVLVTP